MAAYTTIDNPELYFQAKIYSGNATVRSITLDGDEDMVPTIVYIFARGGNEYPSLYDSVRGTQKLLRPDNDDPAGTESGTDGVTAFGSNGFTVGDDENVNNSSETFVAWCWKETADAGIDLVTYTGTGSAKTESHSLSAVPHFMIVKSLSDGGYLDGGSDYCVYHHKNTSAPETDYLKMNVGGTTIDLNTIWNDTAPTSSVFTVGTNDQVNENTDSYINYAWTEKQGYSKFGSYKGSGLADGPMIWLGFKPAFFLLKASSAGSEDWRICDNKRDPENVMDRTLKTNTDGAEADADVMDFCSNGVKLRSTDGGVNYSGRTYIYAAFAEAPFVNSEGVPCNAR